MNNEIQQFRSVLMNTGRGFSSSGSGSAMSELDYSRLINQKEQEIIQIVHEFNRNKNKENENRNKGATGFSSSARGRAGDTKIKIAEFRQLLFRI